MAKVAFSLQSLTPEHQAIAQEFFVARQIDPNTLSGAPVSNDWLTPTMGMEVTFVAGNDAMTVRINDVDITMPVSLVIVDGKMKLLSGRHSVPANIKAGDKVKATKVTQKFSERAKKMQDCFTFEV